MKDLKKLTDDELLKELSSKAQTEWEATLQILYLIIEGESRRLFIKKDYRSTFDFLVSHLKYSEGSANRRIWSARCIDAFPQVGTSLENKEINLSTICAIHRILTNDNYLQILEEVKCKSLNKVNEIVAQYKPYQKVKERITPLGKKEKNQKQESTIHDLFDQVEEPAASSQLETKQDEVEKPVNQTNSTLKNTDNQSNVHKKEHPPSLTETEPKKVESEEEKPRFKIQFEAGEEFKEKLEEVKSLLSGKYPKGMSLEEALKACMDEFIERKSPLAREKRREKREEKKSKDAQAKTSKNEKPLEKNNLPPQKQNKPSRYIPVPIRDMVFKRDKGRCTFKKEDGKCCGSTWDLEIDHLRPYALGGGHEPENLSLRCRSHNLGEAYRLFGKEKMEDMIHQYSTISNGGK